MIRSKILNFISFYFILLYLFINIVLFCQFFSNRNRQFGRLEIYVRCIVPIYFDFINFAIVFSEPVA